MKRSQTPTSLHTVIVLALTAGLALISCSGEDSPTDPGPGPAGPGTATITPGAGGRVSVTTAEGVVVTLTFPAGAVRVDTDVTLRPETPTGDDWMNVALEPAGMVFFEPFQIEATLPDAIDLTDAQLFLRPGSDQVIPLSDE